MIDNKMESIARVDYHYFGPPTLTEHGLTKSPYWPDGMTFNLIDVHATIGHSLGNLKRIAEDGPYAGFIPKDISCPSTGEHALIPIFDRACALQEIDRKTIPRPTLNPKVLKWTLLLPHIDMGSPIIQSFGKDVRRVLHGIGYYNQLFFPTQEGRDRELRRIWEIKDLAALGKLVTIPGTKVFDAAKEAFHEVVPIKHTKTP